MNVEGDRINVQEIAKLCRIDLNSEEVTRFQAQLRDTLEYFSRIEEVETRNEEQRESGEYVMSKTRDDSADSSKCLEVQSLEMNAPFWYDYRFLVPEPRAMEN